MNKSESIADLAKALAAFQSEVKQPKKDKSNPFFKSTYVDLAGVVDAITETAPKHGLSFMQHALTDENERVGVTTIIFHESGEYIEAPPIFAKPTKAGPQEVGSVITYLKRYSLSAAFGITSEVDDDGEKGMGRMNNNQGFQQQQYRQAPPQQQQPNGMASPAQIKAMMAKAKNVAIAQGHEGTNEDLHNIYVKALQDCKIPDTLKSSNLTKQQASKVIENLASKEPQTA